MGAPACGRGTRPPRVAGSGSGAAWGGLRSDPTVSLFSVVCLRFTEGPRAMLSRALTTQEHLDSTRGEGGDRAAAGQLSAELDRDGSGGLVGTGRSCAEWPLPQDEVVELLWHSDPGLRGLPGAAGMQSG